MAFVNLTSNKITWSSSPYIYLQPAYEMRRNGANMEYRIRMTMYSLTSPSYYGYPIYIQLTLNNSKKDAVKMKSAEPSTWSDNIVYTSGWYTITNKTSGTVPLKIRMYATDGGTRDNTWSYSLPVSPAGSVLGTISNFTIGNAIDIPITKYDSNFVDTLVITLGTTTIKTISGITNGTDITFTSSELTAIYNKLPNGPTGNFTFTLTTRSGSSTVGTSTKTASGTIPDNIKPSISNVAISEANTTVVPSNFGVYVQNKSKIKFVITAAAGTGTSITSVKTTINGVTYTGTTITTNIINNWGDHKATITVTDKRNRTASTTVNVPVLQYADPYITTLNAFRCDQNGNANDKGTYLYVHLKGGIYPLSGKNTPFSYKVQWKKTTESSFTNTYTFDVTSSTIDSYVILENIETNSGYNVRATITDYFKSIPRNSKPISGAFRTMNFKPGGHGVGIGKIAELDDVLDIGLQTRHSGGIKMTHLGDPCDFNDITTPNVYASDYNLDEAGYVNAPCTQDIGFILIVDRFGSTEGGIRQELITCAKGTQRHYERFYYTASTPNWGEWAIKDGIHIPYANTNLNNFTTTGIYYFTDSYTVTNIPTGVNGWLLVLSNGATHCKQIWFRSGTANSNDFDTYVRTCISGTWSTWTKIITGKTYPVGTVLITATNTNPSGTYGGTWTLIDKEFASTAAVSGGFTLNSTNVSSHSCYWSRAGHTVSVEISVVLKVDVADTALNMGNIALSTLGITRFTNTHRIVGHSDGGNSAAFFNITTGGDVNIVDVIPDPYISTGQTVVATFTATIGKDHMVDSACDKFYWKKTAQ